MTLFYWRTRHDSNVWPLPSEVIARRHVRASFVIRALLCSRSGRPETPHPVRAHKIDAEDMADWGGVRERSLSSGLPGASGATGRTRFQQVTIAGATAFQERMME
jgi:hypothetical protein